MTRKVTLKVSAAAAAYVRPDAPKEEKLRAAQGEVPVRATDLCALLFFLSRDPDPDVKGAAMRSLRKLPEDLLVTIATTEESHSLVLDLLARIHYENSRLAELILSHPAVEERTVEFLYEKSPVLRGDDLSEADAHDSGAGVEEHDEEDAAGGEGPEVEENLSKYKLMQHMSIADKIRVAMIGDKEWRSLLVKDTNKLVSTAVIKNPRITDPEILAIAKSSELNEEVIRLVSMNRDWIKIYPVRKALVENSKTPLPKALRFLGTLNEKDLLALAKSKNVQSAIARQAQRLVLNKNK